MGRGNGSRLDADLLTGGEIELLMRRCSPRAPTGVRNRALLAVLWLGEGLAVKPKDFDPEEGTLVVQRAKGGKRRVVGVAAGTVALVVRWLDVRRRRGIAGGPLFCTLAGGRWTKATSGICCRGSRGRPGWSVASVRTASATRSRSTLSARGAAVRGAQRARPRIGGDHPGLPLPGRDPRGGRRDTEPRVGVSA